MAPISNCYGCNLPLYQCICAYAGLSEDDEPAADALQFLADEGQKCDAMDRDANIWIRTHSKSALTALDANDTAAARDHLTALLAYLDGTEGR